MQNWFECKVKYEKIEEQTGKEKKVTEPYLVDAVSFTEAEARIYEKCGEFIHTEFLINNISKAGYSEVFPMEDGDFWYKCKVNFIAMDEKSGKEKKISSQMLVMANSVKEAFDNLTTNLGTATFDFEITSVALSPIIDIFPYSAEEESIKGKKLIRTTQFDQPTNDVEFEKDIEIEDDVESSIEN